MDDGGIVLFFKGAGAIDGAGGKMGNCQDCVHARNIDQRGFG
jgi:hypothetical protein